MAKLIYDKPLKHFGGISNYFLTVFSSPSYQIHILYAQFQIFTKVQSGSVGILNLQQQTFQTLNSHL